MAPAILAEFDEEVLNGLAADPGEFGLYLLGLFIGLVQIAASPTNMTPEENVERAAEHQDQGQSCKHQITQRINLRLQPIGIGIGLGGRQIIEIVHSVTSLKTGW